MNIEGKMSILLIEEIQEKVIQVANKYRKL